MPASRCNVEAVLALLLLAASASAGAQQQAVFNCMKSPAEPSIGIAVSGFPSQRLYLHSTHPELCANDAAGCSSSTYVLTGDQLTVTARCGSWAFATFKGAKKVSSGWVAVNRLPQGYDQRPPLGVSSGNLPVVDPLAPTAHPACAEARDRLNEWLLTRDGSPLPSAIENETSATDLPEGVGPENHSWGLRVGDVQIHGKPFKAVSYSTGGTCHAQYTEVWNADFSNKLPIGGDPGEGMGNYESESVVRLKGEPFFAHFSRGSRNIQLAAFNDRFEPRPVCQIDMGVPKRDSIRSAPDPAVCEAVLEGKVSGAPIDDIEPFVLTPEALHAGKDPSYRGGGGGVSLQLVGRGRFDVDNDGMPDDVGIVQYRDDSGAGCGHEYRASWPIKLNADGMPAVEAEFNEEVRKKSGDDEEARLFIFRGKTYYERQSRPAQDGVPEHTVWKLTASAPVLACEFAAVTYAVSE